MKPCVIIFDEFDAIVPCRNSGQASVTDRVVNQFLTYLDGVEAVEGVFVIAITARPDLIDPAVIRPGRIDQHLRCDIPDSEERGMFFERFLSLVNIREEELLGGNLVGFVEETEGFSYGNLIGVLRALQVDVYSKLADFELLEEGSQSLDEVEFSKVGKDEFLKRIEEVEAIGKSMEYQKLMRIYEVFEKGETHKPSYERQKLISK